MMVHETSGVCECKEGGGVILNNFFFLINTTCVKKFGSALGGVIKNIGVCVDTMCQEQTLCMYSPCQERTSNQERTHSMSAIGFGIRFELVILKNPGIDHKIMGVA